MALSTLVTVEEYLRTTYEPDLDYVDGVLEERNLGEWDHSKLQTLLSAYLVMRYRRLGLEVVVEQRVQVKPTRFRIPDVTVIQSSAVEPILHQPPIVCIEILSPDDSLHRIAERAKDYTDFGVPEVWIIDPKTGDSYVYTSAHGLRQTQGRVLRTKDGLIEVDLNQVDTFGQDQ